MAVGTNIERGSAEEHPAARHPAARPHVVAKHPAAKLHEARPHADRPHTAKPPAAKRPTAKPPSKKPSVKPHGGKGGAVGDIGSALVGQLNVPPEVSDLINSGISLACDPTIANLAKVVIGEVVDLVEDLIEQIVNENKDKTVRGQWVSTTIGKVKQKFPGKNVMIVWTKHDASKLVGVRFGFLMCPCPNQNITMKYNCYVFDSGTFELEGDGGWLNWGMDGNFNRFGNKVSFKKP